MMSGIKQEVNIRKVDFRSIFNNLFPSLCVFANKFVKDEDVAKDIVQDVFTKIWSSGKIFKSEKSMQVYFYLSVKNTAFDYLKKEKRINQQKNIEGVDIEDEKFVLNEIIKEETYRLLGDALSLLPERAKEVMILNLEGLSNQEIADNLGISVHTVKSHKSYAIRELRKLLNSQNISLLLTGLINILY